MEKCQTLRRKMLPLSNLSLFESQTIFLRKIISERKKEIIAMDLCPTTDCQIICGSVVGKNRLLPASTETSVIAP